jgi:hypothetical protein
MTEHSARSGDTDRDGPDPIPIVSAAELHLLISDFESLVDVGVIRGTRQEAAQFFSGWLAFGEQRSKQSTDSL